MVKKPSFKGHEAEEVTKNTFEQKIGAKKFQSEFIRKSDLVETGISTHNIGNNCYDQNQKSTSTLFGKLEENSNYNNNIPTFTLNTQI